MKINKLLTMVLLVMALAVNFTNVFAQNAVDDELDTIADQYNKNKATDKYKVVCTREAPVGSRIKKKVCRTVGMVEYAQKEAREAMSRLRTGVGNQE